MTECEFKVTRIVVMSALQKCPSLILLLYIPFGVTIAERGREPVDVIVRQWDLGIPGIRLYLVICGSVNNKTVLGVKSFIIEAVQATFLRRFACMNLVEGKICVVMVKSYEV